MAPNVFHFPFYLSIPKTIEKDRQKPDLFAPELLPSPSDGLFAGAAHSRGCASGNTLAPVSRGITLRPPHFGVGSPELTGLHSCKRKTEC